MRRLWLLALIALPAAACATLLGLPGGERRVFEHRAHVLGGVACVECHREVRRSGDEGPLDLPDTKLCLECHARPHTTERCRTCHGLGWIEARAADARTHLRFEHRTHLSRVADCARCHLNVAEEKSPLLPSMASCLSCHEHQEDFDPRRCDRCHVNLVEEGARPESHVVHREDFVRDHGVHAARDRSLCDSCHSETSCAKCHGATTAALPSRMRFDRPELAGMHRAGFRSRHREEAAADPGMCVTCHAIDACARCHERAGVAPSSTARRGMHPPGWVGALRNDHGPAARQDPVSCASCHGGAGEQLCVGCHRVGGIGGNVHPPGWQSHKDATRDAPCRLCHEHR